MKNSRQTNMKRPLNASDSDLTTIIVFLHKTSQIALNEVFSQWKRKMVHKASKSRTIDRIS